MIIDSVACEATHALINPLNSIRLKVTDRCPLDCVFCHHEGMRGTADMNIDGFLKQSLTRFKEDLGFQEAHLTGGEPTAYPYIIELVRTLVALDYTVKMTSNGQCHFRILDDLKNAGLWSINFSVHTRRPEILANLQRTPKSENWARNALERQLENLIYANKIGLRTKINMVITDETNPTEVLEVIDLCKTTNSEFRLLDDLNPKSSSVQKIIKLLHDLGAMVLDMKLIEGSSSYSYGIALADGYKFRIKSIRKFLLRTMCSHCEVRDSCKEWFYGVRVEQKDDRAIVRLCLHRQGYPAIQNLFEFFTSVQYDELKDICQRAPKQD